MSTLAAPDAVRSAGRHAAGVFLIMLASVLWSLSGIAVKTAQMDPIGFAFYRCLFGAIPMALIFPFAGGRRPPARWMPFSAVLYTLVVTPFIVAMTLGTAASGILLQYTAPVFCALFAFLFQGRRIGGRTLLAMAIAAGGITAMMLATPPGGSIIGPLCGLVSGIAFAAFILTLERIDRLAGGDANLYQIVFINNAGTVLLLLPLCIYMGALTATPWQLAIVAATGVFQLTFPYVLFQIGLRRVHPVEASLLLLLEPVLNPVWVAIGVREIPDAATILGGVAILLALVIEATKPPELEPPANTAA